jgi:NTE family protein
LQGGGSLGAYEVGVYKALYEWLSEKDRKEKKGKSSTFDIIAGTSIGAINAAVLTSYVVENDTYEGSAEKLVEFWTYLSKQSMVDINPWFTIWWDTMHGINKSLATGEAARRYYSAKEFTISGIPNVFLPLTPIPDNKFLDYSWNTWYRFSNEPLKQSLKRFAKFPISTTHEDNQPRLLLLAVDVADGVAVTFDSYPKADGSRKSEYGKYIKQADKEIGFEHVINYDQGITAEHVMASSSFPVNFDYAMIEVESYKANHNQYRHLDNTNSKSHGGKDHEPLMNNCYKKEKRHFWDGGLMANTPLTQLVLYHRNYWYYVKGLKDKAPTLCICVVNVHPTKQEEIPTDHDGVVNRNIDITFSDRSQREEEALLLISDYIDLIKELIKTARVSGIKDSVINELLNRRTQYHGHLMRPRQYKEILEGNYDIGEIIRIERKNDEHSISDKTFDFSYGTVTRLLANGYEDAMKTICNRGN